jgi:hypothetical protein
LKKCHMVSHGLWTSFQIVETIIYFVMPLKMDALSVFFIFIFIQINISHKYKLHMQLQTTL